MSSTVNAFFCDDYGMSLPEPNSAETNQQLVNVAKSFLQPSMQLGIFTNRPDAESTSDWYYYSSPEIVDDYYTNWAPGKPNLPWDDDYNPDWESAILRASDGKWEDARRGDSSTVICSSFIRSSKFDFSSFKETEFMFSQSVWQMSKWSELYSRLE